MVTRCQVSRAVSTDTEETILTSKGLETVGKRQKGLVPERSDFRSCISEVSRAFAGGLRVTPAPGS